VKLDVAFVALMLVCEKIVAPAVVNDSDLTNRTKKQISSLNLNRQSCCIGLMPSDPVRLLQR
jgi:hypothetical protein